MFTHRALPYLQNLADGTILSRSLRIFGMGESAVESLLRDRMNAMTNPTLAPYAKEGEVELRITAKAPVEAQARDLIAPVEAELRALLGDVVYGADVPSIQAVAFALLEAQGLTLGAAESCTGGLVAKCITDLPGASGVFKCRLRWPKPWPGGPAGCWAPTWPSPPPAWPAPTPTTGAIRWDWFTWRWPGRTSAMFGNSIWAACGRASASGRRAAPLTSSAGTSPG